MVSAAGVAPAFPRSQAEYVAATLRAVCPGGFEPSEAGECETPNLGKRSRGKLAEKLADPKGFAPWLIELRVRKAVILHSSIGSYSTLPFHPACKAGSSLFYHGPIEIGKLPWCCPRQAEF